MRNIVFLAVLCYIGSAFAQSSPGWPPGFVPSATQWNASLSGKRDYTPSATAYYVTSNQAPSSAFAGASYYFGAPGTFTLTPSVYIYPDRGFTVNAMGGAVTIALGAATDKLQNQPPGVGYTLAQGSWAIFTTDGLGNWRYSQSANVSSNPANAIVPTSPFIGSGNAVVGSNNIYLYDAGGKAVVVSGFPYPTTGNAVVAGHPQSSGAFQTTDAGAPPQLAVPSNLALTNLPIATLPNGTTVVRNSFYAGLAGGKATYTLNKTANCLVPDNGIEVQPLTGTGCFLSEARSNYDPKQWGASGTVSQASCAIAGGSTAMTLGAFSVGTNNLVNGQPIFCTGAGANAVISAPTLALAAVNGSGTTTWYTVRPIDAGMGVGPPITPVSVSGGATLGTPVDLSAGGITATTHGNTTLDTIVFPGTGTPACVSFSTCGIAIGSYVKKTDVTPGIYVTAFPTANSATLSSAASNSTNGATAFISPTFGVSNNLTITGSSAGGFAIYKGTTNTLSAMNFIATTDNAFSPWHDYGQKIQSRPTWIPATADVAQNDVLRTYIVSGAGTSNIVVANAAINTVTGGTLNVASNDDTTPIVNACAAGVSVTFSPGTYNQLLSCTLTAGININGKGISINSWGPLNNIAAITGSNQHLIENISFNDIQKSVGYDLYANNSARFTWRTINSTNTFNCYYITRSTGNDRLTDIYCGQSGLNGSYCSYMVANDNAVPSTFVNNPTLTNVTCGPGYNNYAFLFDGIVDSVTMYESGSFAAPYELVFQNTVGASTGPHFGKVINFGVNDAWNIGVALFADDTGFNFVHLYDQGIKGNGHPGFYASNTSTFNISGNSTIFGFDKSGVESHAVNGVVDPSTAIFGNNLYQGFAGGGYDKISVESDATYGNYQMINGDQNGGIPSEKCGIEIKSGAGGSLMGYPPFSVGDHAPGYQAPVCDETAVYGTVQINGFFNSPTWITSPSAGAYAALTTTQMLGSQTGVVPVVYASGNVFGTPNNLPTPTAAAVVAAVSGASVNQHFKWSLVNMGGSTTTLTNGGGFTIGGQQAAAAGRTQVYDCYFTNVSGGSEAMTCNGKI